VTWDDLSSQVADTFKKRERIEKSLLKFGLCLLMEKRGVNNRWKGHGRVECEKIKKYCLKELGNFAYDRIWISQRNGSRDRR
jgi:hypothetical protein